LVKGSLEGSATVKFNCIVLLILAAPAAVLAQESNSAKSPPVEVKRQPAATSQKPFPIEKYDFGKQIQALQQPDLPMAAAPALPRPVSDQSPAGSVPKDFKPKTDLELTATARQAVQVSEQWRSQSNVPAAGPDGRVLYSYGAGLPTLVCAPLRVCMIELETGEKLVGEPHIGDSVRWNISPAMYGNGDSATSVIVIKPQSAGLDTNLLITTDRRAYYLRLVSKPEDYVARLAFAYPEDQQRKREWQEHLARQKQEAGEAARIAELSPGAMESMYFDYRIHGKSENLRPVRVFDDGAKTYIQMPAGVQHREAPVLVVVGTDSKPEMVNYRVKGDMYILDRLFDRARLVLGAGKKAETVEITRGTFNASK
jgi:type IV secretion system protein VirB9